MSTTNMNAFCSCFFARRPKLNFFKIVNCQAFLPFKKCKQKDWTRLASAFTKANVNILRVEETSVLKH